MATSVANSTHENNTRYAISGDGGCLVGLYIRISMNLNAGSNQVTRCKGYSEAPKRRATRNEKEKLWT